MDSMSLGSPSMRVSKRKSDFVDVAQAHFYEHPDIRFNTSNGANQYWFNALSPAEKTCFFTSWDWQYSNAFFLTGGPSAVVRVYRGKCVLVDLHCNALTFV